PEDLLLGPGRRRRDLDESQIPGLRLPGAERDQRRAGRQHERLELYAAVRRGHALLHPPAPLHRLWGERDPYLERFTGRQKPRSERKRTTLRRIFVVEVAM